MTAAYTSATITIGPFSPHFRRLLACAAIVAALGPNAVFLWWMAMQPAALWTTVRDPVALVFIAEACCLMVAVAWWLHRRRLPPGPWWFIVWSLAGSLLCSLPALLWWLSRPTSNAGENHEK